MCGIVGYVGQGQRSAVDVLMEGLHRLEYRGYDSSGVAVHEHGAISVRKRVGRVSELARLLDEQPVTGSLGIGHTRWATHGGISDVNSHPHLGGNGEVVVVHNGVIENYAALRERLQALGFTFRSTTDTEVIAHLIAHHLEEQTRLGMYTPNVYADVIEWFGRTIRDRDSVILSLHPHNDRGTAVAAAELAVLAGADRVEGTLFGNGERTGNVDVVTLAMNLFSQGVDPALDFSDIERVRRVAEYATRMPVHPRHPYVGDLVYTAFSGSHQDAIKKGMGVIGTVYDRWEVPYLPTDPKHTGRTYEAIIRVNSQSGKGGVAYLMDTEHGLDLPRNLQIEFSKAVQEVTEESGTEIQSGELWDVFTRTYLPGASGIRLLSSEITTGGQRTSVTAQLLVGDQHRTVTGEGNGPIDALVAALRSELGVQFEVKDYREHALTAGSGASAVAYVEAEGPDGVTWWGVGMDSSILDASLGAVVSAANRFFESPGGGDGLRSSP